MLILKKIYKLTQTQRREEFPSSEFLSCVAHRAAKNNSWSNLTRQLFLVVLITLD